MHLIALKRLEEVDTAEDTNLTAHLKKTTTVTPGSSQRGEGCHVAPVASKTGAPVSRPRSSVSMFTTSLA